MRMHLINDSNLFNPNCFIGYISEVYPEYIKVHFPSSDLLNNFLHSGEELTGGLVGSFIIIEGESHCFLARITDLSLSEKERISLTEHAFQSGDFRPVGKAEILLCFDYFHPKQVSKGLDSYPTIGSKAYAASKSFLEEKLKTFGHSEKDEAIVPVILGNLTSNKKTRVVVSQQALFSRHCAIVGTTGGGKSWTVSKLIEQLRINKSNTILIDPTGEYNGLLADCTSPDQNLILSENCYFDYKNLSLDDLVFLLKPSGRAQLPKLMEAIRSLKIVKILQNELKTNDRDITYPMTKNNTPCGNLVVKNGNLIKTLNSKIAFDIFYFKNIENIENDLLSFDINNLALQITLECIWDQDRNDPQKFGGRNDTDVSNCVTLISRINNLINSRIFSDVFGFKENSKNLENITDKIVASLGSKTGFFIRVGFEKLGYEYQFREILANAIGKYFLGMSRNGYFKENPLVIILDEAHQFLNKSIQDEYFSSRPLDAFDQIAKECRKYGLFLTISTQMPRDIPVGILSQMGAFIVHRLINYFDKEAIGHSCSTANKTILSFLPVLGAGEAILTGVDFPMPISVKIDRPNITPDSNTPRFKSLN